jgi:hypothetical protein
MKFILTIPSTTGIEVTGGDATVRTFTLNYGIKGDKGDQGSGLAAAYAFSWGDASPALIVIAPAGKVIYKTELVLLTAFDSPSALTVGDGGDNSRLFFVDNLDLTATGTYESNTTHIYIAPTDIKLYLTIGVGTTQGNGILLVYIQD